MQFLHNYMIYKNYTSTKDFALLADCLVNIAVIGTGKSVLFRCGLQRRVAVCQRVRSFYLFNSFRVGVLKSCWLSLPSCVYTHSKCCYCHRRDNYIFTIVTNSNILNQVEWMVEMNYNSCGSIYILILFEM